jgi:hypothetical protein
MFLGPFGYIIFLCIRNKSGEAHLSADPRDMAATMSSYPATPSRSQPHLR